MRAAALLAMALAVCAPVSFAGIFTCTDEQGRTVFRDAACPRGERGTAPQADSRDGRASTRERGSGDGSTIERKQVTRVLDRLDNAMARRSAKAVAALLARDAQVHWQVQDGAAQKRVMDRAAYADYLRRAFALKDYSYKSESARVSISKREPRATATRTLREMVLIDGRLRMAQVREKVTLEADGGEIAVLALRREARLQALR